MTEVFAICSAGAAQFGFNTEPQEEVSKEFDQRDFRRLS